MPISNNVKNFKIYFSFFKCLLYLVFFAACLHLFVFGEGTSTRWYDLIFTPQFIYLRYLMIMFNVVFVIISLSMTIYALFNIPYIVHKDGIIKCSLFPLIINRVIKIENIISVKKINDDLYYFCEINKRETAIILLFSKNTSEVLFHIHSLKSYVEQKNKEENLGR